MSATKKSGFVECGSCQASKDLYFCFTVNTVLCTLCRKALVKERALRATHFRNICDNSPRELLECVKVRAKAMRLSIETGIQHAVDHIISRADGGPHVSHNLQILTFSENCKKKRQSNYSAYLSKACREFSEEAVLGMLDALRADENVRFAILEAGIQLGILRPADG